MEKNLIQKKTAEVASNGTGTKKTLQAYIKSMEGEIKKALPAVITPERFTRMTLSAISVNPKLAECTPQSFLGAMMTAAQMGVEPNTGLGQAYLLPYKRNVKNPVTNQWESIMECQFQLGYKGMIDLAYRSGEVSIIQAHAVYENDEFEYELGLEPTLKHKPAASNRGNPIAYYAMFKTQSGGYGFEVMSIDDIKAHAQKFSKSFGNGPWQTNFDEMAKKTVLKRVLKYAPLKSDFVRGIAQDETVKAELSDDMYSVPDTMVYEEADYVEVNADTGEVISNDKS